MYKAIKEIVLMALMPKKGESGFNLTRGIKVAMKYGTSLQEAIEIIRKLFKELEVIK